MFEAERLDPRLVGRRLAEARKARGKTQEQAAAHLGYSRPTLIAVEKGERAAKPEEIVKLAAFYGRSVHEIVRPGAPTVALAPHLRAVVDPSLSGDSELDAAISGLQRFAEDYRELERLLKARPVVNYPPEVTLPRRGSMTDFAEDVAGQERNRLGLGSQPILNLRQLLEADVGVRIFYGSMPSKVAGMYAFVADLGYCVLINRKHPPERRRASLAHEYGHFLGDRHRPGADYLDGSGRKLANERFAEAFGLSFLMPASGVRRQFREMSNATGDFQVADLCRLADFYFVGVQTMTLRLEDLGLISKGMWQFLVEKGFKSRKAAQELGLGSRHQETDDAYPERYRFLAVKAYESGEISEGQLARFLRCDPVTAREVVAECLSRTILDSTGRATRGRMPFEMSLLNTRS